MSVKMETRLNADDTVTIVLNGLPGQVRAALLELTQNKAGGDPVPTTGVSGFACKDDLDKHPGKALPRIAQYARDDQWRTELFNALGKLLIQVQRLCDDSVNPIGMEVRRIAFGTLPQTPERIEAWVMRSLPFIQALVEREQHKERK